MATYGYIHNTSGCSGRQSDRIGLPRGPTPGGLGSVSTLDVAASMTITSPLSELTSQVMPDDTSPLSELF